ncbi:hypothetical protein [Saccharopolyspora sp. CA-218241]|uniref:hypothetical protein n=1 Tax=Saccharopolyspora sp. CA-218241 TaxID=3240027 RepID=UPI003D98E208
MTYAAPPPDVAVHVDWEQATATSRTELTTYLWAAPVLRRGEPAHDRAFAALRALDVDHARFLAWWSHPRLSVPALEPPTAEATSWDFSGLDPFVDDFLDATAGRPVIADLATIPAWMFTGEQPAVADDPAAAHWDYERGQEFRDPSLAEVADYFERLARWYVAGGFTDELGRWHESGRRHRFAYWEVLCEPDFGHQLSPATYTRLYDEVVKRLRPLDPEMRFTGLSLSLVTQDPEYFWHFLDPANHEPGIPLDAFSYHFYACPDVVNPVGAEGNAPFDQWPGIFFAQADGFVAQAGLIDSIKRRLSPGTRTHVNEVGTFTPDMLNPDPDVPPDYWALSGAVVAYLWSHLVELGIELVGVAEFAGYPGMVPGVTLVDWETGRPNARYWSAKLLADHFGPGDRLVTTTAGVPGMPDARVHARGFLAPDGRKLLLVNKGAEPLRVDLGEQTGAVRVTSVDTTTAAEPVPSAARRWVELGPFATAVAEWS